MGGTRIPNRTWRLILPVCLVGACDTDSMHTVSVRVGLHPDYGEQQVTCETQWLQASVKPRDIAWTDPWQLITTQAGPIPLHPQPDDTTIVAMGQIPADDYTHLFLDLGYAVEIKGDERQIIDIVEPIAAPFVTRPHQQTEMTLWLMLREDADVGSSLQIFAIDTEISTHD